MYSIIPKDPRIPGLTELLRLAALLVDLVVEELGGRDVVEHGEGVGGTQEGAGEDHGVEGYVVFAHELVELNVVVVLPPLFPFLAVVSSDTQIANRCIKPHIEHLVAILL